MSDSDSEEDKSVSGNKKRTIRVLEFSGKRSDWNPWSEKFMATAEYDNVCKLLLCLKNLATFDVVPMHQVIEDIEAKSTKSEDDKKILELAKLNKKCYRDLMLSMNCSTIKGKVAFRLVKNCKSSEYPEGNSRLVWKRLNAKFASKTTTSLLGLKKRYENSSLQDPEDDPDDWISKLEGYMTEIETIDASSAISEKDLMLHVMNNLPKEYEVILDGLESRIDKSGDEKLTIEVIREKLNGRYERMKKSVKAEDRTERSLLATFPNQFKGKCYNCGKYGHKGVECPEKKQSGSGFPIGQCWFCGDKGHSLKTCKDFLAAKSARNNNEVANFAYLDSDCESENLDSDNKSFDELGF